MAGTAAGHDDRVVERRGQTAPEQGVDERQHEHGQDAGRHRLRQAPRLADEEQLDGEGHRQDEQGEQRYRRRYREQRVRQPAFAVHDVGLHAGRGRGGRDAYPRQHDDLDAGQRAAQQVDWLPDAALELILHLDRARLRWRHDTMVSASCLGA